MGFLDKVKNMFIEEIEEEEPIKKEVIQVQIPSPKKEEEKIEKVEPKEEIPATEKREEKFVFPVYFDDKDFEKIEKKEEKKIEKKIEPKPIVNTPMREAYGIKKEEEKKVFKPTPIISPVYGVLDKNYRKEEIVPKKRVTSYEYRGNDKVDIDDVRKKAYGTLEDDLENNLFEKTSILFSDEVDTLEEKVDDYVDILEEPRHRSKDSYEVSEDYFDDKLSIDELETDNLIEEELNKNYVEEKRESRYVEELNDSDLFNLIDSMYEKRDDE